MKMTTPVLIIVLVHTCTAGLGQITLKEKNAPLEKVLAAIEKQTKYVFLYDPDDLKVGPVTIDVKNIPLQETLKKIFKGMPIEFTVVGDNVLLKKKPAGNAQLIADVSIRGTVVDKSGQPMPGVTVFNQREKKGTETDSIGVYSLKGVKGDLFRFSFVGYKDQEIVIGDRLSINISLEIKTSSVDQVVVIGYGSSKRKDLTGAVSVVALQDMERVPFNTFDNALAGKAAGVDVTKTDGTPGGMVRIRIRGSSSFLGGNDPLYVIDGVPLQVRNNFIAPGFLVASPVANLAGAFPAVFHDKAALPASYVNSLNSLGGLDPEDIESMTILKDASSAAIYGSKAANGVVLITTKTGKTNTLPRIEASWSSTVSSSYRPPKLLNATQYKALMTEAAKNTFEDDSIGGILNYIDPLTTSVLDSPAYFGNANTDWVRQVTRTTLSNHVGLSIAGGGTTSKYFSSITYTNTPGVLKGTNYQRISGKFNVETQAGSRLRFAANLLAGFTSQDIGGGAYAQALLARPDLAPRDASGNYTNFNDRQPADDVTYTFANPAALVTATNNGKVLGLLGSLSGSYAIFKDLTFKSAISLNLQNYNQRNYFPGYISVDIPPVYPGYSAGVSSEANSRFTDWFLENTLSYNRRINEKHSVNVVIGQSYESTKYSYFTATGAGYPNGSFSDLSSADTVLAIGGNNPKSPQSHLISFYARTNYSYRDKYLFTFTGRADGSSKFGSDRFDYFPSGALAWRISRESFLNGARWLNDLKLRGSYGLTGNQNIGDQVNHTFYSTAPYAGSAGLIPTVLGNEGIKPEITKEADVGLDISLFSDRLYASFDYYNRQTSNAILSLPVNPSSAYLILSQNAAGIRNRGFELSIGGDIIRTRDFKWAASVNVTWNRSLVTKLAANVDLSQVINPSGFENVGNDASLAATDFGANTTLVQGKPLGLFTGHFVTGIIKTQAQLDAYSKQLGSAQYLPLHLGDPMYRLDPSTAADGYEYPQSNVLLGEGAPNYFGGMTQGLSYRHFDLQCFFTFSQGGHLLWAQHGASVEFYDVANAGVSILNRYTPTNTNTQSPRLDFYNGLEHATNLDVFGSSYFKLRSLTLSYHVDQALWMKRTALQQVRLFISATNIFTITKYPGSDPETSDDAYSIGGGYIDAGNYPAVRTFSFGVKAGF